MNNRFLRQLNIKPKPPAPEPADTAGLGVQIQQIIDAAVQQRVADQLEKQKPYQNPAVPVHRRPFTNKEEQHEFPAPPPTTKPPMPIITMTRDAAGRIKQAHVGRLTFTVERDGADRAVRLVPQED